ncbi:MAG: diguanylate cyclase [Bacillota bacterium]
MNDEDLAVLASQLAATEDPARIGDLIVTTLDAVSGCAGTKVYLLNRSEGTLVSLTEKDADTGRNSSFSLSEATLPGLALRQGCQVRAGDELALPLTYADREVGVLSFNKVDGAGNLEEKINRLKGVFALALADLAARQEMLGQWRFLEVITTLNWLLTSGLESREFYDALHQLIKGLINFDWMKILVNEQNRLGVLAFFRDDEAVDPATALYPSDFVLQSRFAGGQPDIVEDLQTIPELAGDADLADSGLQTVLVVPLVAKSGVVGGLCFYSKEKGKYAEKDFPLAQQLAGALATAIENTILIQEMARKNQEIEESHRRLATLNIIAETLTRSLELEMVLQEVLAKVMEIADWHAGAVLLQEDREGFLLAAYRGFSEECAKHLGEKEILEKVHSLPMDEIVVFDAADASLGPVMNEASAEFSLGVFVPLRRKDKVQGVLTLFHKTKQGLSPEEKEVLDAVGSQIGVAVENTLLYKKVKKMAERDALTGLYNRHKFFALLDSELKRCQRYKSKCGVLLLDIDHFKDYNDTFGHLAGDQCLKQAAQLFQQSIRETDVAARYGGEEFVVLVVEADVPGVIAVAERLRGKLEAEGQKEPFPTVSIGMALYPDDGVTTQDLLLIADNALYTAKRLGRNRIVWRDMVQTPGYRSIFGRK